MREGINTSISYDRVEILFKLITSNPWGAATMNYKLHRDDSINEARTITQNVTIHPLCKGNDFRKKTRTTGDDS